MSSVCLLNHINEANLCATTNRLEIFIPIIRYLQLSTFIHTKKYHQPSLSNIIDATVSTPRTPCNFAAKWVSSGIQPRRTPALDPQAIQSYIKSPAVTPIACHGCIYHNRSPPYIAPLSRYCPNARQSSSSELSLSRSFAPPPSQP